MHAPLSTALTIRNRFVNPQVSGAGARRLACRASPPVACVPPQNLLPEAGRR